MMIQRISCLALASSLLGLPSAEAAPRDIQFASVDFDSSVVELRNFGDTTQPLDGWRFCSHDDDQVRLYSSTSGLDGISMESGDSLFIHFLDDAPAGEADCINVSDVGSVAKPLDRGPYAIQIYFPPLSFGDGNTIADHLQWSIDGVDDSSADDRSDEAEEGGVWTDQDLWIATDADASLLVLTDTQGNVLHGPADYAVDPVPPKPAAFEIESIEAAANGDITITWPAQAGVSYQVMRGTDLVGFSAIGTTRDGTFTDTAAPAGRAFYVVVGSFDR